MSPTPSPSSKPVEKSTERLQSGPGFILRRTKADETTLRCVLFSPHFGKVLVTAKGAMKTGYKLRPCLEPFAEADFQLYLPGSGPYARLIGARLIHTHGGLRTSYPAFQIAARCCEATEVLVPFRHPARDIYFLLKRVLTFLDHSLDPDTCWLYFTARFLEALGHGDMTSEISRFVAPSEGRSIKAIFDALDEGREGPDPLARPVLGRALSVTNGHLNQVLPWRLKSSDPDE